MWKPLTRAFQWCIIRGGQHLVEVSQNEAFLQKKQSCKMSKNLHRSNLSNQILPQEKRVNCNNNNTWIEFYWEWLLLGEKGWKFIQKKLIQRQILIKFSRIYPQTNWFYKTALFPSLFFPNLPIFLQIYLPSGWHNLRGVLTSWLDPEFGPQNTYVEILATKMP